MTVTLSKPADSAIAEAFEAEQQLEQDYRGLVRDLAGTKTVSPKGMQVILSATGRTAAQLQADVDLLTKRRQAAAAIADGANAGKALSEITQKEAAAIAAHETRVEASKATRDRELAALSAEASPLRVTKQRADAARFDLVGRLMPADLRQQLADAEEALRRFNTSAFGNGGADEQRQRAELEGRLDALRLQALDVE